MAFWFPILFYLGSGGNPRQTSLRMMKKRRRRCKFCCDPSMVNLWIIYGKSMVNLWIIYGWYMDNLWKIGSVVTWSNPESSGDSSTVRNELSKVRSRDMARLLHGAIQNMVVTALHYKMRWQGCRSAAEGSAWTSSFSSWPTGSLMLKCWSSMKWLDICCAEAEKSESAGWGNPTVSQSS